VGEKRIVLRNCGEIDPGNIETYLARDGFRALKKARGDMTPGEVVEEVKSSGLKGRGGAGFACGVKWEIARTNPSDDKYLICNADEGEMGTFKDRYVIQNDPFSIIEGIAIAAYAIGVKKAYIYLRAEYRYLLSGFSRAIEQVKAKGLLRDLEVEICEGAGAYICGEESALMNSMEGRRGEARFRPPYPPVSGLWQTPTIINNVETLCNVPHIILKGASWFASVGTKKSKGTKVFSVSGDVRKPGVYELEMGARLKHLVEDLAEATNVKLVQVGGATGRMLPSSELDVELSYEGVLGSGAVTVIDETRDVIDVLAQTIEFLAEESCGKCAPCREGTEVMVEILERLARGEGFQGDLSVLQDLCKVMSLSSLCGLGQGAPIPVRDSLHYFRPFFENRIKQSQYVRGVRGSKSEGR
jgi:NADH:ubiquinone oxidoreductase subunit F (NADH-binding)